MKTRFLLRSRVSRWLLVAGVVLAAASVALSACGGGSSDRAFVDKYMKMWDSNDAAAVQQFFTADAVLYWPEGATPAKTVGIDQISSTVKTYPIDPMPLGDGSLAYVPSAKDIQALNVSYKGARFIACPVVAGRDLYMMVLQVRDGKVANQWISPMFPY
jgi:hypothetical protein